MRSFLSIAAAVLTLSGVAYAQVATFNDPNRPATDVPNAGTDVTVVRSADLNNDGFDDLIVGYGDQNSPFAPRNRGVEIYLNDGSGSTNPFIAGPFATLTPPR